MSEKLLVNPRLRLVGISGKLPFGMVRDYAIGMNPSLLNDRSEFHGLKLTPLKQTDIYETVVQLDGASYNKIMKAGFNIEGYGCCRVFHTVLVLRCYNCNGFNHSSRHCAGESYVLWMWRRLMLLRTARRWPFDVSTVPGTSWMLRGMCNVCVMSTPWISYVPIY